MRLLALREGETVMIGDDIEISVVDIRGDKVRLAVNCPREMSVHRKEVYDAVRPEPRVRPEVGPEGLDRAL